MTTFEFLDEKAHLCAVISANLISGLCLPEYKVSEQQSNGDA